MEAGSTARRKVFLRLMPWLLLLYVVAYIDRVNVSFATLEMSADLGFSAAVYGFGAGIFFVGYFLLEVPGAVIAQRWSIRDPRVALFACAYFFGLVASNGLGFWLPTMVKSLSGFSTLAVTLLVSLPYSLGLVAKLAAGWSSDRSGERRWHTVGLLGLGAAGLAGGALSLGSPWLALTCICFAVIGLTGYTPSFWAHALGILGGTAGAAAIGLINSIGNLGSFAGPYLMGWVRQSSDTFTAGVLLLAGSALVTGLLVVLATPRTFSINR